MLAVETIDNTLQLGQLREGGNTAASQSRGPIEDHFPFPSSTSQLGPAKDGEFADAFTRFDDLLPVPPSILQLSEANDEGGTIPSQDLNSAPELATAPLLIQQCEGGITTLSQESMLAQKLALPPSSETIELTWCSPTQNWPSSHPPIHRLLLQLLANPDLAASAKHLSFSGRFAIQPKLPSKYLKYLTRSFSSKGYSTG